MTGKLATVAQMTMILWALAKAPEAGLAILIWVAGLLTLLSGVRYILDGVAQLDSCPEPPPTPPPPTD